MPYLLSATPALAVLFVLPVLLVLLYLAQKRQKQGTLSLHVPVILNFIQSQYLKRPANRRCVG